MDETTTDRVITELGEDECRRLLATEPVGRLAWTSSDGPSIVPVNFTVDGEGVQIRTAAYAAMARECDDSRVAFEVDAYDADSRVGWSVVVSGTAHLGITRPGAPAPDVWPVGAKAAQLTVRIDEITGRRVRQR